jgi:hypothetical protein
MGNKTAIAKALSALATLIVNTAAAVGAAAGGSGAVRYSPKTYPDARPGRQLRRSARHARGVDRAVIDQWLMWRN